MTADRRSPARRYLLGDLSDEECAAIEQEYFTEQAAVDRMGEAEEDLIEDYLASRLTTPERHRFERLYLASPDHVARVEIIRELGGMAGRGQPEPPEALTVPGPPRPRLSDRWRAAAAALVFRRRR